MHVGVDIGGTFTDLALNEDGRLRIRKLLSTPADPSEAMLAGLAALSPGGLAAIGRVSHGSTVATNAILERKGAPTALIVTQGFRDLLAIGRQNRPELYALRPEIRPPLVPRQHCYELPERLDHRGAVLVPLDMAALDAILDDIVRAASNAAGIESVAVCLLYSYVNPAHELAVRARALERDLFRADQIALSSEVLPEFREVERASTVVLEAYVRPVMSRYLEKLERGLPPTCTLRIIKSDGGVVSARRARREAIHTALSGPAAGVIGGFYLARQAGFDHVITLDMGGTSTDVALCPGEPIRRAESEIDGLPLRTRLLDIETIGAGGGSLAWLDAGGALRVGPASAGAMPGPACYGRGGRQATVTDANAVLGRLDAAHFLGGAMALHLEAAGAALAGLGTQMGIGATAAALGVIDVANANIDRALRRVSVARGYDPREFTLLAFGGAGPMHGCAVAERLEIPRLLVPRYPGVLCAFGMLTADVLLESSRSVLGTADDADQEACLAELERQLAEMIARGRADLRQEGIAPDRMILNGLADMRYRGQSYELTVPFRGASAAHLRADFDAAHARRYGHAMPERPVQVVTVRLQAVGLVDKPVLVTEPLPSAKASGHEALLGHKRAVCSDDGRERQVSLYDRERLLPGARFDGPALVVQLDSTVWVAPGWSATVDGYQNIILRAC
ncbi:MAG: hydantoinase/oxoprolinase family protein [Anaerolineae bacterium]|nr:hydantoinase/oxoprolinase family protein [Anaerolineae bacterium]